MFNYKQLLLIGMIIMTVAIITPVTFADKRECKELLIFNNYYPSWCSIFTRVDLSYFWSFH